MNNYSINNDDINIDQDNIELLMLNLVEKILRI